VVHFANLQELVTNQSMSKEETFQDLSLSPPSGRQALWRRLYLELRGPILDRRLKAGAADHLSNPVSGNYYSGNVRKVISTTRVSSTFVSPFAAMIPRPYMTEDR
jgi:hypothetical protein